tara:strand:- start:410 stop:568 length:159 start_codon:yes stop_codon:yes gene_type:complete
VANFWRGFTDANDAAKMGHALQISGIVPAEKTALLDLKECGNHIRHPSLFRD